MPKTVAVDIDNTLWDLAPVLFARLKEINPEVPPFSDWDKWRFWKSIVDPKTFYRILLEIHLAQDRFIPFPEARPFLAGLKDKGCRIVIASHREEVALEPASRWFAKHDLPYDEFHFSHDKSAIFDACCAVVDDSPLVLDRAYRAGLIRTGLVYPWNEWSGHPLFASLMGVLNYLENECRKSG